MCDDDGCRCVFCCDEKDRGEVRCGRHTDPGKSSQVRHQHGRPNKDLLQDMAQSRKAKIIIRPNDDACFTCNLRTGRLNAAPMDQAIRTSLSKASSVLFYLLGLHLNSTWNHYHHKEPRSVPQRSSAVGGQFTSPRLLNRVGPLAIESPHSTCAL